MALKNNKLQKTDLVTEALTRQYFRKRLEIERSKLKILNGVDLGCFIDKMIEIKNYISQLSNGKFARDTARIYEKGRIAIDKNIDENGKEADKELFFIVSLFDIVAKGYDNDAVRYRALLAIQDCRKVQEFKEQHANSLEKTLKSLP